MRKRLNIRKVQAHMLKTLRNILSKPFILERLGFWLSIAGSKLGRPVKCTKCGRSLGRLIPVLWRGKIYMFGLHGTWVRALFTSQFRMEFVCAKDSGCCARPEITGPGRVQNLADRRFVHMVLAHEAPGYVDQLMRYLEYLAPGVERVLVYGGKEAAFDEISYQKKIFCNDPRLRGIGWSSSHAAAYRDALSLLDSSEPFVILCTEGDHLPLRKDYAAPFRQLLKETGADFLGAGLNDVTDSNFVHYQRMMNLTPFQRTIDQVSVRPDRCRWLHSLGTGFVFAQEALEAYCASYNNEDACYVEIEVPTLLYHLGFRGCDVLAVSDIYDFVRHLPEYTPAEVIELAQNGACFVHPCKAATFLSVEARLREIIGQKAIPLQTTAAA